MDRKRRQIQPFNLDVLWGDGPRTAAWDSLWSHILRVILSHELSTENLDVAGSRDGDDDRDRSSAR